MRMHWRSYSLARMSKPTFLFAVQVLRLRDTDEAPKNGQNMKTFHLLLAIIASLSAFAQYKFDNKKAEKLYYKIDDAFLDYDYATILEEEETIKATFLVKEDTVAANMYSYLGETYYYEIGNLQKALDFYSAELNIREKLQPKEVHTDVLALIALINTDMGNYQTSEELLVKVLAADTKKFEADDDAYDVYFESAMALSDFYIQVEKAPEAIETLQELKKNVKSNSLDEVGVLKSLGDAYAIQGSFKRSEKYLFESLALAEENGQEATFEYASVLNSLGVLYLDKGLIPKAEESFELAINVLNRLQGENEDAITGIESNLAQGYFERGDYEKAIGIQKEVLTYDREFYGEESIKVVRDLLTLGQTQANAKRYDLAEGNLIKGLEILKSSGDEGILNGRIESVLSRVYTETDYSEKAIAYGKMALVSYKKSLGDQHPETAFAYENLANAYLQYDDLAQAEPFAKQAYSLRHRKLGRDHPFSAKSAKQMALISWKKKDTKAALGYYKETFENYFKQINTFFPVLTEEEKATFYYTNLKPAFEQYVSFIEESAPEDASLIGEIYDYQLALKGLIMYATSKVRESILASGNEALIAKYEEWISQKEQLAKLFSKTDLDIAVRNRRIDSLTTVSNQLEQQLSKASDVFGKNFASRKYNWKDVQKTLKPGEAAIEMVRYRDFDTEGAGSFSDVVHYGALIVRPEASAPEMVIMRNGAQMEKKYLANYRNAIKFKISENYSYKLFWKPIANKLEGVEKIYFAPDGVYNQISIYTLQNPETKAYLLNEIDLAIVTNTKDLLATNRKHNRDADNIFFGYPDYNLGSDNVKKDGGGGEERGIGRGGDSRGLRSGGQGSLARGASVPRGVRGNLVRYMRSFNGMAMLPGTKKEVQLIDELYESYGKNADIFLLNEAVETRIKKLKNPRTLHIATHGFFLELDPDLASRDAYVENPLLRSGLILAGANSFIRSGEIPTEEGDDDGILTAYEAMNLNLDETDVVVLSACETGLGEIKNGEGVYGLQRAFQIAGAEAIIMSMWSVDDNATQELMTIFYTEWLSHGDKQLAFNQAQKKLSQKYDKPYFWGAFVMVGG